MAPDESEFEEMLERIIEKMVGARSRTDGSPNSDNPEDYPRAVEVIDDEAVMSLEKLIYLRKSGERKMSEIRALKYEHDALRARFFLRLEDVYPHISNPAGCAGTGWRNWKGKTYYVGWDYPERSLKDSQSA